MENRQLDSTTTIEELRNSGKYPIVDLKIFDRKFSFEIPFF